MRDWTVEYLGLPRVITHEREVTGIEQWDTEQSKAPEAVRAMTETAILLRGRRIVLRDWHERDLAPLARWLAPGRRRSATRRRAA